MIRPFKEEENTFLRFTYNWWQTNTNKIAKRFYRVSLARRCFNQCISRVLICSSSWSPSVDKSKSSRMSYMGISQHIDFDNLPDPNTRFELLEIIGEGTYGEVFAAKDHDTGKDYLFSALSLYFFTFKWWKNINLGNDSVHECNRFQILLARGWWNNILI